MKILVDSSIWIDYFRKGKRSQNLDWLIEKNYVAVNEVILTEILPPLQVREYSTLVKKLNAIQRITLQIDWVAIREYQTKCIHSGLNGIGIPDLLIVQNAIQNQYTIYTIDKHFFLMSQILHFNLYIKQ